MFVIKKNPMNITIKGKMQQYKAVKMNGIFVNYL